MYFWLMRPAKHRQNQEDKQAATIPVLPSQFRLVAGPVATELWTQTGWDRKEVPLKMVAF